MKQRFYVGGMEIPTITDDIVDVISLGEHERVAERPEFQDSVDSWLPLRMI